MTSSVLAPAVSPVADSAGFDHVLAGVALTGAAARLAGLLERGFLLEAGWDPVLRVLSLPAAHPLLGRTLCRVGGCSTTVHGRTGGVCWHCFTRLREQGLSGPQIAALPQLPPLPTRRPAGCAVPGCHRYRGRHCARRISVGCAAKRVSRWSSSLPTRGCARCLRWDPARSPRAAAEPNPNMATARAITCDGAPRSPPIPMPTSGTGS